MVNGSFSNMATQTQGTEPLNQIFGSMWRHVANKLSVIPGCCSGKLYDKQYQPKNNMNIKWFTAYSFSNSCMGESFASWFSIIGWTFRSVATTNELAS